MAIRRPLGTIAITAVVLVLGLFATGRLPVNLLPNVVYPLIRISVNYPGVAPEVIEEQLVRVLERQLSQTENLVLLSAEAEEGRADLNLVFDYGVNLDVAMQDAARLLEAARAQLPDDVEPPRIRKWDPGESAVFESGFSSSIRGPRDVRDWVETRLAPQLQSIPGVSGVEAIGGQEREIEVVLDQQRMNAYGLDLQTVAAAIGEENRNIAAGNVTSNTFDVRARVDGRFTAPGDLAQMLIPVAGSDRNIRLDDVAMVRDGFREQRVFVRLDGASATQMSVFKQPDANTVEVVEAVSARLESLRDSGFIPEDIRWQATKNEAFFVRGSIDAVTTAAVSGAVLAMLVVLAFLGSLRKSLAIGLAIPVAILATFSLMGLGGLTLNVISLGGLALGVGLLLDNAIVMLENIARHREQLGKSPDDAAHDGADEVASAIVAGTLTNLAAVVPFLLASGFAAMVFRDLIITISFAVAVSLVVALTLVPMASAQLGRVKFRSRLNERGPWRAFEALLGRTSRGYEHALHGILRWRWAVLAASVPVLIAGYALFGQLGSEFLPQLDNGEVGVRVNLPPGTTPEQTNDAAQQIEAVLRDMPHVESLFTITGGALYGGVVTERNGRANVDVRLSDAALRPDWPAGRWVVEARKRVKALDLPGARLRVDPPSIRGLNFSVSGEDFDLKVVGGELAELERVAREAVRLIADVPGLAGVEMRETDRSPQLSIAVDRARAAAMGLNLGTIGDALRSSVTGAVPTRYTDGQNEYDVRVRLPDTAIDSLDALSSVLIANGDNGLVRLGDVASLDFTEGPSEIERENQVRIQRIVGSFNTSQADVGAVMAEVQRRLAPLDASSEATLIYGGQFESIQETNRQTRNVLLLAVFLVFAVLVVQYERLSNPVAIIITAPFCLVGAVALLWVTGTPLSSPALLGMVLLIGIVVNNAILLIEYIERGLLDGLALEEAVAQAGRIRLRPILMTVLTTVFGMLPLALGMGSGAALMQPLAIAVIGGLLFSTVLTLVIAPCLFVVVRGAADRLSGALFGRGTAASATS
ncbi:efflux RND transporter permease subunit [Polycyclovorans algicola]|uniref:efflux RND transporter permease subunit n=1 Tax=Polycyclovorans algicola TaxID=616992 RepID=UPI0006940717